MLLLASVANAAVLLGGAFSPVGTGALAWDDANAWSGTLAGEFDGLLRPPLTVHGGWAGPKAALLGGVALVRFGSTTFSDSVATQQVGALRLSLDYRRWLHAREAGAVGFYGQAGGFGIVPNALDQDEAYTIEEQADADEASRSTRARIGGFGGEAGLGAEYVIGDKEGRPAVGLGLRYLARLYRGQQSQEDYVSVSTVVLTEAAFVVEFTR